MKTILITGGAGFIGSHVVRLFVKKYPDYHIVNLDKLTCTSNLANLKDIADEPNYTFVKGDICDFDSMVTLFKQYHIDGVVHLAAESEAGGGVRDPFLDVRTNVMGTLSLLQAARLTWEYLPEGYENKLFYHVSTDEVYGPLALDGTLFAEERSCQPHSLYAAGKAGGEHLVKAFHYTHGMVFPVIGVLN